MGIIIYVILFFFTVVGICDTIHSIHIRLIYPKKHLKKIMILKLDEENEYEQINFIVEQYKWYGTKCFDRFICLCNKNIIETVNFEFSEEFEFIENNDASKLCDVLGEEYGLKFRQH